MDILSLLRSYANFTYSFLRKEFKSRPFKLLDVGSGNHSPSKTKRVFPKCEYHGLDVDLSYNYDEQDVRCMHAFYPIDLTSLDYQSIPDNYFDAIQVVHVIEHLANGDEVLINLVRKLKAGGVMYVEFPGRKSTTLPSMYGTLNFYDDPSHIRVYSFAEIAAALSRHNCIKVKAGTRRNVFYILGMPIRILHSVARGRRLEGNIFWDVTGFAEFVFMRKT